MRFLFNPALLHFLVILAAVNLLVNVLFLFGAVGLDQLGWASEVAAIGFVIALLYTALWERPPSR